MKVYCAKKSDVDMKINILSIGENMSSFASQEIEKYSKRLPPAIQVKLTEIPLVSAKKRNDSIIQKESKKMLEAIEPNNLIIALNANGLPLTSNKFADNLLEWQTNNSAVTFLIGGPEGLSPDCNKKASLSWSLSSLTFPHMLVRVILMEQLYRGCCIINSHPYSK